MLKIKLIRKGAKPPTRGSVEAAGLDLYSASTAVIGEGGSGTGGFGSSEV